MTAQYEHIAVATDFSPGSALALEHAVRLARRDGAVVSIVYVVGGYVPEASWPSIWAIAPEDAHHRLGAIVQDELDGFVAGVDTEGVRVQTVIAYGDPADQLIAWVRSHEVELLVLAPTGKSGLERLLLGSTARILLGRSPVPVWVARGEAAPPERVVVGVDLRDGGDRVAAVGLREATAEAVVLDVIHAFADPGEERIFAVSSWEDQQRYRDIIVKDHRERFGDWCAQNLRVEPARVAPRVVAGRPWRALVAAASEREHALIVVGRHEHNALHDLFLGSTTDTLVRRASGPVLVVP